MTAAARPEPDWKSLYLSICRCNAVYDDPDKLAGAFAATGSRLIAAYATDTAQAALNRPASGRLTLTIPGTHVTEGPWRERLGDLAEDARFAPYRIDADCSFAAGPLARAREIFRWALPLIGDETVDIEGHSLGADATCAAPVFLPDARIGTLTAWSPAKSANPAYWRAGRKIFARLITVYPHRDPFFHYPAKPWAGDLCHNPGRSILWLKDGTWSMASEAEIAPGDILDWSDHDPARLIAVVRALMERNERPMTASVKLRRSDRGYDHWCPACKETHTIFDNWSFDGNMERPTFQPSVKITGVQTVVIDGKWTGEWVRDEAGKAKPYCCHYILTAGQINFCGDCTHELAGHAVPLPDLPEKCRD